MLERFRIVGQVGVNDEIEPRQIDPACGDVGRDADPGPAVPQRLKRLVALVLAELARERDDREAALEQQRLQMPHGLARVAEHQRRPGLHEAERVDDSVRDFARQDAGRPILDVGVAPLAARDLDPHGVALEALRQRDDRPGQGRREQKRPPLRRRRLENELQVLAEAEVEHLVRLVEHHGFEERQVEPTTLQMVAQAAGCPHDDVGPLGELALFAPRVHAADA
jgi:hypothetical protein